MCVDEGRGLAGVSVGYVQWSKVRGRKRIILNMQCDAMRCVMERSSAIQSADDPVWKESRFVDRQPSLVL